MITADDRKDVFLGALLSSVALLQYDLAGAGEVQPKERARIRVYQRNVAIDELVFSEDGKYLLAVTGIAEVKVIDVHREKVIQTFAFKGPRYRSVHGGFLSGGQLLLAAQREPIDGRAIASYLRQNPVRSFRRTASSQPARSRLPRRLSFTEVSRCRSDSTNRRSTARFRGPWSFRTRL